MFAMICLKRTNTVQHQLLQPQLESQQAQDGPDTGAQGSTELVSSFEADQGNRALARGRI